MSIYPGITSNTERSLGEVDIKTLSPFQWLRFQQNNMDPFIDFDDSTTEIQLVYDLSGNGRDVQDNANVPIMSGGLGSPERTLGGYPTAFLVAQSKTSTGFASISGKTNDYHFMHQGNDFTVCLVARWNILGGSKATMINTTNKPETGNGVKLYRTLIGGDMHFVIAPGVVDVSVAAGLGIRLVMVRNDDSAGEIEMWIDSFDASTPDGTDTEASAPQTGGSIQGYKLGYVNGEEFPDDEDDEEQDGAMADYAELIIFDSKLSDTDLETVGGYLNQRYSLGL